MVDKPSEKMFVSCTIGPQSHAVWRFGTPDAEKAAMEQSRTLINV